jgi:hypothetical protein
MQTLQGTVRHRDLEGGYWVLETQDAQIYRLHIDDSLSMTLTEGQVLNLKGEVHPESQMGISMDSLPVLEVKGVVLD